MIIGLIGIVVAGVLSLFLAIWDSFTGCSCGDVDGGPYGLPHYEYCPKHDPDRSTE